VAVICKCGCCSPEQVLKWSLVSSVPSVSADLQTGEGVGEEHRKLYTLYRTLNYRIILSRMLILCILQDFLNNAYVSSPRIYRFTVSTVFLKTLFALAIEDVQKVADPGGGPHAQAGSPVCRWAFMGYSNNVLCHLRRGGVLVYICKIGLFTHIFSFA
jgi:hypothetical protein